MSRAWRCFVSVGLLFVMFGTAPAPAPAQEQPLDLTFTVHNWAVPQKVDAPVTFGVPIPQDLSLTGLEGLRILNADGQPVPAQFTPLARWGGAPDDASKPVRWLLVDFLVDDAPGESAVSYRLVNGGGALPGYPALRIEDGADAITIDTGPAQFSIDKADGSLSGPGLAAPLAGRAAAADGAVYTTTGPAEVSLEMSGPVRAVIQVKGSYGTLLDYTARYWFYAGQAQVRLFYTVENNTLCPLVEYGQLACYHIGEGGGVNLADLSLVIPTDLGGDLSYHSVGAAGPLTGDFVIYQDSSGADYWDRYATFTDWDGNPLDTRPRMQAYVSFRGYRATLGGAVVEEGDQAIGWLGVSGSDGMWSVGVRDFWQNFPKALRAAPDGVIEIGLFPGEFGPDDYAFTLRAGEHKTHEILLAPGAGFDVLDQSFTVAIAPEWYVPSGGFGMTALPDFDAWPDHENYLNAQLDTAPTYEDWMDWAPNLPASIERTDFYGIFDYGDWPQDYEGYGVAPLNVKYDNNFGAWVQWARGGDPRWFDIAEALSRHEADIDILHNLHSPRHWGDGITFGHSYHDESGFTNPHRNEGGTHPDVAYGLPGLLATYYLTGYEKAWDAALELADAIEYRVRNDWMLCDYFPDCNGEGVGLSDVGMYDSGCRPKANSLVILTEAYRATADPRYLEVAEVLVEWARPDQQPYINGPTGEDMMMKPWLLNMYLRALAYYIEMRAEFGLPDDGAAAYYMGYIDWLRDYALLQLEPIDAGPRAAYPYEWWFDGREGDINDEWAVGNNIPSVNNWLLLGADAMAYAYRLSGDPQYMDIAESLFRAGARDPWFVDDPNAYSSSKETANSTIYGNIFLHLWAEAR
ncbi:MAG: hypothetical protein JXB47_16390 [Anaerolineae bacterium]|nr:hypothetical protein [Anaerolineae bacterium]